MRQGQFTAPVLLKGSDIPEASLPGRKPAGLENANVLFWWRFMCDHERTGYKPTVCFLEFASHDMYLLATTYIYIYVSNNM